MISLVECDTPAEIAAAAPILDAVPVAMVVVDENGRIVFANAGLVALTGFESLDLVGREIEALVPLPVRRIHRRRRDSYRKAARARPMGSGLAISCVRADGSSFPADVSLAPMELPAGRFVVATVRDDSDRRRAQQELVHTALHDPLTGLPNRSLLFDRLDQALDRASRSRCPVTVFFIDLDGFKQVNDNLGHAAGDVVLAEVAQRFATAVRPGDTVARVGGDEFVAVCEGIADASTAHAIADRIVALAAEPLRAAGEEVSLTASVGIVAARELDAAEAVDAADRAMYVAKRSGGGRSIGP